MDGYFVVDGRFAFVSIPLFGDVGPLILVAFASAFLTGRRPQHVPVLTLGQSGFVANK